MQKNILILFCFFLTCCVATVNSRNIQNPPTKNFVKLYKEMEVTRCENISKKCKTKVFNTIGSGLIIDIGTKEVIVLSAGHVCSSAEDVLDNDKNFSYKVIETVTILNYQKKFFDAHVIHHSQSTKKSSDLCTLYIPDMNQVDIKQKIRISATPPKIGEEVYYIGAPAGIYHPPTALIIRGIFSGKIDNYNSLASVAAAGGASGSAILSSDNKIYGVLWAVHPAFPTATIITDHKKTYEFLLQTKRLMKK